MRYIDSGQRDPDDALGSWLEVELDAAAELQALRWQTGFFSGDVLGYFAPAIARLRENGGTLGVLIGSNDGTTLRSDVAAMLAIAGPPRDNQRIGVVSFDTGYFHPKTVHLVRGDGTSAAYVGSANLTGSGTRSLHVEAGLILDTDDGDDPRVVRQVAEAIDWWFEGERDGLTIVSQSDDLDVLVATGVLNVPRPRPSRRTTGARGPAGAGARLSPLVSIPALPDEVKNLVAEGAEAEPEPEAAEIAAITSPPADEVPEVGMTGFWKTLSNFDVSESSAPGQMIIPIRFLDFFGELEIQKDERAKGGVRQSHREFPARFIDGGFDAVMEDTRVILYEPAADHPRQNIELRYTFHNRDVRSRLAAGDILVFSRNNGDVVIERRAAGSMGDGKFGEL